MEWVTKKVVAILANQWLRVFLDDVDPQEVNDSLSNGKLSLSNSKIRHDAMSMLDGFYGSRLPLEIVNGVIGRISMTVPFSNLFNEPLIVEIEDVLILLGPSLKYDKSREEGLEQSRKKSILEKLFSPSLPTDDTTNHAGLLGVLYNRIWNNLELRVTNIHIRYEDLTSCPHPLAMGLIVQSLQAETTNSKWKKMTVEPSSSILNKVVECISASIYVNPNSHKQNLASLSNNSWQDMLVEGIRCFSINNEKFKFVVQPFRCKVKIRQHIIKEANIPGLLVDAIWKENFSVILQTSQYQSLLTLIQSLRRIMINRRFRKYRPSKPLSKRPGDWWKYAYKSIVHELIQPYSWNNIRKFRNHYHKYLKLYRRFLIEKRNRELEADVSKLEDQLNVESIIVARMHAKILLSQEDPELVRPVVKLSAGWFTWLLGNSRINSQEKEPHLDIISHKQAQVFSTMSNDERKLLLDELFSFQSHVGEEKHEKDIDQKIYFSLKESSICLYDDNKKEIGFLIFTGIVLSLENRFGVDYQKTSFKVETFTFEAANKDGDLVTLLKLAEGASNIGYGVALACDLERNPLSGKGDYGFTFKLDPIEMIYHQQAIRKFLRWLYVPEFVVVHEAIKKLMQSALRVGKTLKQSAIERRKLINLDIDLKSPFLILPEHGFGLENGGSLMVIDFGGLKVCTDYGGVLANIEESTRMELEEKLYDHVTIIISHLQLIFADSGDEWRALRIKDDSDLHLLSRVRIKINLANAIYPHCTEHPKRKIDVHITPLKFNLTELKINLLANYVKNFPKVKLKPSLYSVPLQNEFSLPENKYSFLRHTVYKLSLCLNDKDCSQNVSGKKCEHPVSEKIQSLQSLDTISQTSLELAKYFPEESEEESESNTKPVDLFGFEDNASPSNKIRTLARFCIDDLILNVSRNTSNGERSYVMINVTRILLETALMDFGPALQLSIGSAHFVDKLTQNEKGEYLELFSSDSTSNFLTILYRNVRSNCPEFRSHFHSCEQSLIFDFSKFNVVWHSSAVPVLYNFTCNLYKKADSLVKLWPAPIRKLKNWILHVVSSDGDPPIPSGTTKWSSNINLQAMTLRLSDVDSEVSLIELVCAQCSYVCKANEKMVFRISISDILVEDLSEEAFYQKICEVEQGQFLEAKFVKNSFGATSKLEKSSMCKADSFLSIQVGRMQFVLLFKFWNEIMRFFENTLSKTVIKTASESLEKTFKFISELFTNNRIALSVQIQMPTVLIPQKSTSPILLVLSFGNLKIDNLMKNSVVGTHTVVTENILLELGPLEVSCAMMTLGGSLELQEPILESITIKIDAKRSLMRQCKDILSWEVSSDIPAVHVNIGQRDLSVVISVLQSNFGETINSDRPSTSSLSEITTPVVDCDDSVGELAAFLVHSGDVFKIGSVYFSFESITVILYTDMKEILSSPVRDAATAFCKVQIGEIEVDWSTNSDWSHEATLGLKSCDIYDVRLENSNATKKIFGQFTPELPLSQYGFKINSPLLLDSRLKVSTRGDWYLDVSIDRTRTTISLGFLIAVYRFIWSIAPDCNTSCDATHVSTNWRSSMQLARLSICQNANREFSSPIGNTIVKVVSIAVRVKRPEIVLFPESERCRNEVFVLKFDFQFDYSRHQGYESFEIHFDKVNLFSSTFSIKNQNPYTILKPFYIEFYWHLRELQAEEKIDLVISDIYMTICPSVCQMITDIALELTDSLSQDPFIDLELPCQDMEDLWKAKPISCSNFHSDPVDEQYNESTSSVSVRKQLFTLHAENVEITLETIRMETYVPVLYIATKVDGKFFNWSHAAYGTLKFPIKVLNFNNGMNSWECLLEPVPHGYKTKDNNSSEQLRDVLVQVKLVSHITRPIGSKPTHIKYEANESWSQTGVSRKTSVFNDSGDSSSSEEGNPDNEMVVLKPSDSIKLKRRAGKVLGDVPTIAGYSLDSDSETEGNVLYRISSTFSHMFSSNEESENDEDCFEDLEADGSTDKEPDKTDNEKTQSQQLHDDDYEQNGVFTTNENGDVFEIDSTNTTTQSVFIVVKDPLNFNFTSNTVNSVHSLISEYTKPSMSHIRPAGTQLREFYVINDIGPNSKVTLVNKSHGKRETVISTAKYQEPSSLPSSPASQSGQSRRSSASEEEEEDNHDEWQNINFMPDKREDKRRQAFPRPCANSETNAQIPDAVKLYEDIQQHHITIQIPGFDPLKVFVGTKSRSRVFQLSPILRDCRYYVVVDVTYDCTTTLVTVRSPLQVLNDLPIPVNICFKKAAVKSMMEADSSSELLDSQTNPFDEFPPLVSLQPDELYTVPMMVAYHSPIFITPSASDHYTSTDGIWWKEMESAASPKYLSCPPKATTGHFISVACSLMDGVEVTSSLHDETLLGLIPNYKLKLTPPIVIYNHLAYTMTLEHETLPTPVTLDPGGYMSLLRTNMQHDTVIEIQICNYQGTDWTSTLVIPLERNEASRSLTMNRRDGTKGKFEISVYTAREATTSVYIYSPYWFVNKTGLPLKIRGLRSKITCEGSGSEEILLFRYRRNLPHKIKIRVLESEWSRSWSCDAVGTSGIVVCEDRLRLKKFRLLARISQSTLKASLPSDGRCGSSNGYIHLTKIVTLVPYFFVRNTTAKPIMYMQDSDKNGLWFDIGPNQCEAFWPSNDDPYLVLRRRTSQVISQRFHFNSLHTTVLRMEKGRSLVVTVEGVGTDKPVMITFAKFTGQSTVCIKNWTDDIFLRFRQKDSNQTTLLPPKQSVLYTWDDPTLPRELTWNVCNRQGDDFKAVIHMDKHGSEKVTVTSIKQKVLRVQSQTAGGTPKIRPKDRQKRPRARTTPSTSSTDDEEDKPLGKSYLGLKSQFSMPSPSKQVRGTQKDKMQIHWVSYIDGCQRVLLFSQSDRLTSLIAMPTQKAQLELFVTFDRVALSLVDDRSRELAYIGVFPSLPTWQLEVDGVWKTPPNVELCSWLEDQYMHSPNARVNIKGSLEVDLERMFMLAPFCGRLRRTQNPGFLLHSRKSLHAVLMSIKVYCIQVDNQKIGCVFPTVFCPSEASKNSKPCLDFSLMATKFTNNWWTIKHSSLICKEFQLNLEKDFLLELYYLIRPYISQDTSSIHAELKKLLTPITFTAIQKAESKPFGPPIERGCLAGLSFLVSYSPKKTCSTSLSDPFEAILTSLGVSIGEIKNVKINVNQYERESVPLETFLRGFRVLTMHQVLQQVYVLILGLETLGNPYQRLRDVTEGIKDPIYDPSCDSIDKPDDYIDEISSEFLYFCNYISGGTVEKFPLLNSLIEVDASLIAYKKSEVVHGNESKDLVTPPRLLSPVGIIWAISGLIVDPVDESLQASAECFLRGRGRGLLGLTSSVSFGTLNSVFMVTDCARRVQSMNHEGFVRRRLSRHVSIHGPLRPFNLHEAEGVSLLTSLPNRFVCSTDRYFAHVYLSESKQPPIFYATERYLYLLEAFGHWGKVEVIWRIAVRNLAKQPDMHDDTMTFQIRQDDTQAHLAGSVRVIQCKVESTMKSVMSIVTSLMTLQMEELPCPTSSSVSV